MGRNKAPERTPVLFVGHHFLDVLRIAEKLAGKSKVYSVIDRKVLIEVYQKYQAAFFTVTDLEVGVSLKVPCKTDRDDAFLIDVRPETIKIAKTEIQDTDFPLTDQSLLIKDNNPGLWPPEWTHFAMTKESRSDIYRVGYDEFARGLEFTADIVRSDVQTMLSFVHVRNRKRGVRMEATDGHRAHLYELPGALTRGLVIHPSTAKAIRTLKPWLEGEDLQFHASNDAIKNDQAGNIGITSHWLKDCVVCIEQRSKEFNWRTDGSVNGYPDIDKVVPVQRNGYRFQVVAGDLQKHLDSLIYVSGVKRPRNGNVYEKTEHAAVFKKHGDLLHVHHEPSKTSWPLGGLKRLSEDTREDVRVRFNPFYLQDIAIRFKKDQELVGWLDPEHIEPMVIDDKEASRVLLMPIRL